MAEDDLATTLIVIPCSGDKERTGFQTQGQRVGDDLPSPLAQQLLAARDRVKPKAEIDESTLLPAWRRYRGELYKACRPMLESAIGHGQHILIISGGYGVVKATEPIGWYRAGLKLGRWPPGLLERCIVEYALHHHIERIVSFASGTTDYARLLRRIPWEKSGATEVELYTPDLAGEGGAMKKSPRVQGEALASFLTSGLTEGWASSSGKRLREERFL